ncbi:hypothetical protein B9Z52_05575 [Limnohabitans sp. Jir72]|nr:hypothetical protein B9Z52_05575 [Limnohabitans sp. Jir72]
MQSLPESTALLIHPAHELLALIVIALHVVLPLGTWAMLSGYRDPHAKLWLSGLACYSLGFSLSALNTLAHNDIQTILLSIFYLTGILLMLEALARDLDPSRQLTLKVLWVTVCMGGAYFTVIILHGFYPTWGLMSLSTLFVFFSTTGILLSAQLIQRHRSRSLYLIVTALVLLMSGHLLRLGMLLSGRRAESFQVAAFTWNSNYLVLSTVLTMILISFGYWGYLLDKMRHKTSEMQAKQWAAEMLAEESQLLIKERDQLLMVNARVSAISSLSSFSAMLVHDISQPLQALEFGLYNLQHQIKSDLCADHLRERIHELQVMSGKAGEMVSHLRQLMVQGQDHVSPISPHKAMQTILPILQGEAAQRKISLTYRNHLDEQSQVMANTVMLQRIIFNAVGNALDVLNNKQSTIAPEIKLAVFSGNKGGKRWTILQIADNGPRFSTEVLSHLNTPIQTSKPHGMGLGLLLLQSMVRLWDGHAVIGNTPADQPPGARIELWLTPA